MRLQRLAILSTHTSPLASLGGHKTGGMNVYVGELAQELARRGIFVDIYTRRTSPDTPEIDRELGENVRVITLNAGPMVPLDPGDVYPHLSEFTASLIAFTTRQRLDYDLVYSHYWLSGWVAAKLNEVWATPFIHMFHTLGHMKNRITPGFMPVADVRTTVETNITQWAARIIAATPAEYSQLLWLYRVKRRKVEIVPPGVNLNRFHPAPQEEAKAAIGLSLSKKLLLFVGRIEPLKAVDSILEAMALIRKDHPELLADTCFAVIGGDPDNPGDSELSRLMHLSDRLELNRVVDFLGAKDQSLLPDYYAAATAVIMPSDYESFGMVALEAMASGTPVIATEVGGLAHVVQNGKTGFLVPVREPAALAERIMALLASDELRQQMSQNAVEAARAYGWPAIVDRLLPIFEAVVREHPVSKYV